MSREPMNKLVAALKTGAGLKDEFIYHMSFDDYKTLPDPYTRTIFTVKEVQENIRRYPNPERPGELFQWDIHGRLFTPATISIPDMAVVMIHGGAVNEYEFIFTPDGPEAYLDLTKTDPTEARVGVAQHIASLGIPVLTISLPGHYSRKHWASIAERRPEFVIGEVPGDTTPKPSRGLHVQDVRRSDQSSGREQPQRIHFHVGPFHRRRVFLFDGAVRTKK